MKKLFFCFSVCLCLEYRLLSKVILIEKLKEPKTLRSKVHISVGRTFFFNVERWMFTDFMTTDFITL